MFLIGFVAVLYVMFGWWADVIEEGEDGEHTPVVRIGPQYGFILFIMSEVMFFVARFWAFIKTPCIRWGRTIRSGRRLAAGRHGHLRPLAPPLINTLILLLSALP